jgi:hypothetical protein
MFRDDYVLSLCDICEGGTTSSFKVGSFQELGKGKCITEMSLLNQSEV